MNEPEHKLIPPKGVDLDRPSVARVYDYILGGSANWAVDRVLGDRLRKQLPIIVDMAVANRQFLNRAVTYLCEHGIRQFIDIGAGVPTAGNTHQAADQAASDSRVVYVDNDPVAVAHATELLKKDGDPHRHGVIDADLRNPDDILAKVEATGLLDLNQPVALLILSVLHVTQPGLDGTDRGPASVARLRELLPSGSCLVISHGTRDGVPAHRLPELDKAVATYSGSSAELILRSHREIQEFFGDFELVEPGMTWTGAWHPEIATPLRPQAPDFDDPAESMMWSGIGRKP